MPALIAANERSQPHPCTTRTPRTSSATDHATKASCTTRSAVSPVPLVGAAPSERVAAVDEEARGEQHEEREREGREREADLFGAAPEVAEAPEKARRRRGQRR